MNRKLLPLTLMLVAGAAAGIITFIGDYSRNQMLLAIFLSMLLFAIIGALILKLLNKFDKDNEKAALDEGEVIEKETSGEEEKQESTTK